MGASDHDREGVPPRIPTAALTVAMIPAEDAPWQHIAAFALAFDGYEYAGSFERCADIANGPIPGDVDGLRAALFFEQRRWRHFGEEPDPGALAHIHALLARLRLHLGAGRDPRGRGGPWAETRR